MQKTFRLKQVANPTQELPSLFNEEIVDVMSKEIKSSNEELSAVRVSAKENQPRHVGFPYVLHVPTDSVKALTPQVIRGFLLLGVEFKEKQPLFYKDGRSFTRVRIKNGDTPTAERLTALLEQETSFVFKNWK